MFDIRGQKKHLLKHLLFSKKTSKGIPGLGHFWWDFLKDFFLAPPVCFLPALNTLVHHTGGKQSFPCQSNMNFV